MYTLETKTPVISSNIYTWLLFDHLSEKDERQKHARFDSVFSMLIDRLQSLRQSPRPLSTTQTEEIQTILDSLLRLNDLLKK